MRQIQKVTVSNRKVSENRSRPNEERGEGWSESCSIVLVFYEVASTRGYKDVLTITGARHEPRPCQVGWLMHPVNECSIWSLFLFLDLVVAGVETGGHLLGDVKGGVEICTCGFEEDCIVAFGLVVFLEE